MHIKYNTLLENTAKQMLMKAYPVEFSNGKFETKQKRKALKAQMKLLKKTYDAQPKLKRAVLDQCKYGEAESRKRFRSSLLQKQF